MKNPILHVLALAVTSTVAPAASLVGLWEFNDPQNLGKATVGADLVINGASPAHHASLADDSATSLSGVITTVQGTSSTTPAFNSYLVATNPIGANGGGAYTNAYSLLFDIFTPAGDGRSAWRSLLQTALDNNNDGDLFLNPANAIGVGALTYQGTVTAGQWTRIVLSVELGVKNTAYLNGVALPNFNADSVDGRFSLDPTFLLFGDEDGENSSLNVGAVALFSGALTAGEVFALGGAGGTIPEPAAALLGAFGCVALLRRAKPSAAA